MELEKGIELWHKRRNGKLNPEEQALLDRWISGEEGRRVAADLDRLFTASAGYRSDFQPDTEKGLDKLRQRIEAHKKTTAPPKVIPMAPKTRRPWIAAAASVAVLLGIGLTYMFLRPFGGPDLATVNTGPGDTLHLLLPDKSLVVLNENSIFSYPTDLGEAGKRIVRLDGEAFFEVNPDAQRPFEVHSQHAKVVVLGTKFNFRSFSRETKTEVEVEEGKVALMPAGSLEKIELKAGELGIFDSAAARLSSDKPKALNSSYWRRQVLELRGHTLLETQLLIQRHFGVQINIDAIGYPNCTLSLNIDQKEPELAVDAIAAVFGAKVQQLNPKTFFLEGGKCR